MRKKVLVEKLAVLLAGHPVLALPARPAAHAAPTRDIAALPVTPAAEVALTDVAPVLDCAVLKCLAEEIEADGVRAALDMFFTDTPDCLALMRKLPLASARARIKDEAHRLKGAAGTFGLAQLSELARGLELSASTMTAEDYRDLLDRLEASFQRARAEAASAVVAALAR
jgi:two-component system aerobic respiration control sensor histidine kinase ArcB